MFLMRSIIVLGVYVSFTGSSGAATVKCQITQKYNCSSNSCENVVPTITSHIDTKGSTYSRCDAKGCDDYRASVTKSGDFINIALPERGMLAKISIDNGFVEVATVGLTTLISYGVCSLEE